MADRRTYFFNGLEGASGEYCLKPRDSEGMIRLLEKRFRSPRILKAGLRVGEVSEAGWGVVWADDASTEVRAALQPLLRLRQHQADSLYRELRYFEGESVFDFLERYGVGPDTVDPARVPYYLLLVGSPENLPFRIEVELAVSRAVGRITFESPDGYAEYAERCAAFEGRPSPRGHRRLSFFGVENRDDDLTGMAAKEFVAPLAEKVRERNSELRIETFLGANATKDRLRNLLERPPSVLLTAGHAVRFRSGSPRQKTHQGALVCADWPGPIEWKGRGAMPDEHLFAGVDVPAGARLEGLVAFLFACYSAGTPRFDSYEDRSEPLAPAPFVSPLPRTLLRRGALAVVGHVDLVLEHSFFWYRTGSQLEVFDSFLHEVVMGRPVGLAMQHLSARHAQLAVHVAGAVERAIGQPAMASPRDLYLWAAFVDARHYVLLGDPAARLAPIATGSER